MYKLFEDFFDNEKIYYRAELDARSLHVIQPHLMPENIKSAIIWLIPYYTGPHPNRNVSLYALSRDYHIYAKTLGEKLCEIAKAEFPGENFYCFCDSSPINEIDAAIKAGLGVLGKNRLLINDRYGSYIFIGAMLSTLEPSCPKSEPVKSCIKCGKCLQTCEFLSGKSEICLSDLNQKKHLLDEEILLVRSHEIRWGCDVCQEVCPMNKNAELTPIEFFRSDIIEKISKEMLEQMDKKNFKSRAYSWRGKNIILRNLEDNG